MYYKLITSFLTLADVRIPGMEGGPVFDEQGNLVGMLTRPLRQRGGAAEVQVLLHETIYKSKFL